MVRQAQPADLPEVLAAYEIGRETMRQNHNPTQWGDVYPPKELLVEDIRLGRLWVVEQGGTLCGAFAFFTEPDPFYATIENGAWLNDEPYVTIHRLTSNGKAKGIVAAATAFAAAQGVPNVRIDTHADNHIMQHTLEKLGYKPCGTVYVADHLSDHSPRIGYQLICADNPQ